LKKKELYDICLQYSLITSSKSLDNEINFNNVPKDHLIQNIEIHFLKKNKKIPREFIKMNKKELIDFIQLNNVQHYTPEMLKKEIKFYEEKDLYKRIIIYNIMKYDNIDTTNINNHEEFVKKNKLDTDLKFVNEYAILLKTLYDAFDTFCDSTGLEYDRNNKKSFPKIIELLKTISR